MTRLFDVYIAVDWSARSVPSSGKPTKDAIWVGEKLAPDLEDPTVCGESYWCTRFVCRAYLCDRLRHHVNLNRRVFIGFDFAYGYPTGFAKALGLDGNIPRWRKTWNELSRLIIDDENNNNNRFEVAAALNARCGGSPAGPFWGCPAGRELPTLAMKSPAQGYPYKVAADLAIDRLRWVDKRERGIQPIWKLTGSGSVGGQTLVGIPVVRQLRDDPWLAPVSRVWPFETGFTPYPTPNTGPFVLHVEIWPGVVPDPLDADLIRDRAQVRALVYWLSRLDTSGQLNELFAQPARLSAEATHACVEEEGWILGAGRL